VLEPPSLHERRQRDAHGLDLRQLRHAGNRTRAGRAGRERSLYDGTSVYERTSSRTPCSGPALSPSS
jgi:hypothetical protein